MVTPTTAQLKTLLELLCVEATTQLCGDCPIDFRSASSPHGCISHWVSFSLGKRAKATERLSFIGCSLEKGLPSESFVSQMDSMLFWMPENFTDSEKLLRQKWPQTTADIPLVLCINPSIDAPYAPSQELRAKALRIWASRYFRQVYDLHQPSDYFKEGLEWALSF